MGVASLFDTFVTNKEFSPALPSASRRIGVPSERYGPCPPKCPTPPTPSIGGDLYFAANTGFMILTPKLAT